MKKISKKFSKIVAGMIIISTFAACNEQIVENQDSISMQKAQEKPTDNAYSDFYEHKKAFAIALHKAMGDSKELRKFIKLEALKKFDNDYDVLYNYVKNNTVEGTNSTLRELLLPYFEDERQLDEIEAAVPLLTIFVPSLPENSFSAEIWDTAEEVPLVALKILGLRETPFFGSSEDESFLMDGTLIPGFPVVVVKDNERIILPNHPDYDGYQKDSILVAVTDSTFQEQYFDVKEYYHAGNFRFKFVGLECNGSIIQKSSKPNSTIAGGKEITEAWEIYGKYNNDRSNPNHGWHRDYIYYGIDKIDTIGPFIYKYKECISSFRMLGNPQSAIGQLSQASSTIDNLADPILRTKIQRANSNGFNAGSFWTDGDFEFNVYVTNNFQSTTRSYKKLFTALPTELFDIEYTEETVNLSKWYVPWTWGKKAKVFTVSKITILTLNLGTRVRIDEWNLKNSGTEMKVKIAEADTQVEHQIKQSANSKWVTNFEINASWGTTVKVGGKAGATHEQSQGVEETLKWTDGEDDLGEVDIDFGDNIIISEQSVFSIPIGYRFKTYPSGSYEITFRPIVTQ